MQPAPGQRVADPCCGTGGFLLAAHDYIADNHELDRDEKKFLRDQAFSGTEIVDNTARLCAMNLFLHNIGSRDPDADPADHGPRRADRRAHEQGRHGPDQSALRSQVVGDDGRRGRQGRKAATSTSSVRTSGPRPRTSSSTSSSTSARCSRSAAAASSCQTTCSLRAGPGRRYAGRLLEECDVHTMLRLPTGIFYAQGVKANVVFLERRRPDAGRDRGAVGLRLPYEQALHAQDRTLKRSDLDEFVPAYKPGRRHRARGE